MAEPQSIWYNDESSRNFLIHIFRHWFLCGGGCKLFSWASSPSDSIHWQCLKDRSGDEAPKFTSQPRISAPYSSPNQMNPRKSANHPNLSSTEPVRVIYKRYERRSMKTRLGIMYKTEKATVILTIKMVCERRINMQTHCQIMGSGISREDANF